MPSPEQWQDAIARHGFDLKLDTDFDTVSFSGYLPCVHQGTETGFEYFYEALNSTNSARATVELITHADYREYVAAVIVGAVLAEMSDGAVEEPQEGVNYSGEQAIEWAKKN